MQSTNLFLLSFPNKDIDYPTIALPLLSAAVKEAGFNVRTHDFDVELKDAMISQEFLNDLHDQILPALLHGNVNNEDQFLKLKSVYDTLSDIRARYSFADLVKVKRLMQTRDYAAVFGQKETTALCKLLYQCLLRLIIFSEFMTTTPEIERMFPDAMPFRLVDSLIKSILDSECPLVGISYEGVQRSFTFWFIERLRRKFGFAGKVVVGGPDPTFYKHKILNRLQNVDYLIYNEGERALPRLVAHVAGGEERLEDIQNLIYRENGELKDTRLEILNSVPDLLPDFSVMQLDKYIAPVLPIQAARGCAWGKCRFCMHYKTYSQDFYGSPAEQVVFQMAQLQARYGISNFYFADDDFTTESRTQIADAIIAQKLKVRTLGYARFDKRLNREILSRWKAAGMMVLEFGMESGSQRVINHIKKGFNVAVAVQNLIDASELGLVCKLLMFYDFPSETYEELQDSIDLIERLASTGMIRYFIELRTKLELQPLAPLWKEVVQERHPDSQHFLKIWEPRGDFSISTNYRLKIKEEIKAAMLEERISRLNSFAEKNGIVTTNDVNLSVDLILAELAASNVPIYAANRVRAAHT